MVDRNSTNQSPPEAVPAASDFEMLRRFFDYSLDLFCIADQNGYFSTVNPAFESVLGFSEAELLSNPYMDFVYPEDREITMQEIEKLVGGSPMLRFENRFICKNGQIKWISWTAHAEADGYLYAVGRDITETKQLETAALQQATDLQTVAQLSAISSSLSETDEMLQMVADLTKERFQLYHVHIYLLNDIGDTLVLSTGSGTIGKQMVVESWFIPLSEKKSMVARAAQTQQGIIVNDTQNEQLYTPNPDLPDTRSEMAVPMVAGEAVVGVLDMHATESGRFTVEDVNIFSTLATQIATNLENVRLLEQTKEALASTERLYKMSSLINEAQSKQDLLASIYHSEIFKNIDLLTFNTVTVDKDGNPTALIFQESFTPPEKEVLFSLEPGTVIPITDAPSWLQESDTVTVRESDYFDNLDAKEKLTERLIATKTLACAFIPLHVHNSWIGMITLQWQSAKQFTPSELRQLALVAHQLSLAYDNIKLLSESQSVANEYRTLASIVENHQDFIGVGTLAGEAIYVNPAGRRMMNIPPEADVNVMNASDFYPPAEAEKLLSVGIPTALAEGVWQSITTLLRSDGAEIPVEQIISINYDNDKNPASINITMRDLREKAETQATLDRRARQLSTVLEVSVAIATILDTNELLQRVVDLTKERFDLYHAHIHLLNDVKDTLILTAGAGDVGRIMVEEGRRIPLTAAKSLVASVARSKKADGRIYESPEDMFMPHPLLIDLKSELAIPILIGDEILGVLDVRSDKLNYFDDTDTQIYTALASQVAVALQNARSFSQSQQALNELNNLNKRLTREGWAGYLQQNSAHLGYTYDLQEIKPHAQETAVSSNYPLNHVKPIEIRGAKLGELAISEPTMNDQETANIIAAVTDSLNAHIENLRLTEQTQQALSETEEQALRLVRLNDMSAALNRAAAIDELFQVMLNFIPQIISIERASLALYDEASETFRVVGVYGENLDMPVGTILPSADTPMLNALAEKKIVAGYASDEDDNMVYNVLFAPLFASGQDIGTINIAKPEGIDFSEREESLLLQATSLASASIQNKRLLTTAESRARREQILREITERVRGSSSVENILQTAVQEIGQALGRRTFIHLNNPKATRKETNE